MKTKTQTKPEPTPPPETAFQKAQRSMREIAEAEHTKAMASAELIKASLDIYLDELAKAFPETPLQMMGVATLKTIDGGKSCETAIGSFQREGRAPVAMYYDPMRYVVVLIYDYEKKRK